MLSSESSRLTRRVASTWSARGEKNNVDRATVAMSLEYCTPDSQGTAYFSCHSHEPGSSSIETHVLEIDAMRRRRDALEPASIIRRSGSYGTR